MSNGKRNNLFSGDSLAEKLKKAKEVLSEESGVENLNKTEKEKTGKKERTKSMGTTASTIPSVSPKLFVSGRLDRKNHKYIARSLVILREIEEEVRGYCRGGDLSILNYLIKEGLRFVKNSKAPINVDMTEIEHEYTEK